jgi:hypothetical protein
MTIPRRIGLLAALAVAALGASAPAAPAGESESIETRRGAVTFDHLVERVTAEDKLRDGLGIRAYVHWTAFGVDSERFVTNLRGADTVVDGYVAVRERIKVWLTMCYTQNGEDIACSYAQRAEA